MEHPFGYNVLAGPLHVSGARASTPDTRLIERTAPAYHEEYSPHRGHEGTGNVNEPRESGLNSDQYRHDQRVALEDQNLDIAMALNQMTYGHQNLPRDRIGLEQSNDSYGRMVRNMGSVPLGTSGGVVQIPPPSPQQKFDMLCYRFAVTYHRYPTEEEQLIICAQNGLDPTQFT